MRILSILLLFTVLATRLPAQELVKKYAQSLDSFVTSYPQEKLFIHTDRTQYTANETIWFKTYCSLDGLPSPLSKIIYVELVDKNNRVMEKRMLPATNGSAAGDIFLKKELPTGTYSLNAYTLWMQNFPHTIFSKQVFVYNTDYKNDSKQSSGNDFQIQFLPEGGNLIETVESRIAFKALSVDGQPIAVSGEIQDSKNNRVTSFKTSHDGMGDFFLKPMPGETYKATFVVNGKTKFIHLPKPVATGISLAVNNQNPSRVFFNVQRSEGNTDNDKLTLIGTMNQTVVFVGELDFTESKTAGAITKKNLPSGILQLTAVNANGLPLAERLVFISNYQLPQANLKTDTLALDPRSKNVWSVNLSEFKNISPSISIVHYGADSTDHQESLLSSLLLTSDIKGYVTNAAYYFKNKDSATLRHLDLVMLTHGWRHISFDKLMANQFPALQYPVESGLTIRGKLGKTIGKSPIANSKMDFITKTEDSLTIFSTVTLTNDEQFALNDMKFKKTATVYYQGSNVDKSNALTKVTLFPSFFDTLTRSVNPFALANPNAVIGIDFSSYYAKKLEEKTAVDKAEGKLLGEVVVKAKKMSIVDSLSKTYASALFQTSDQSIVVKNATNIWQMLQMNVSGITVDRNEMGETTVFLRQGIPGVENPDAFNPDPTTNIDFYLNEMQVTKDVIESLDPGDVVLVKVWKGVTAMALGSQNRVIALYTDKNPPRNWRDKGFDSFKKEGYSVTREFFSLDYSRFKPVGDYVDQRPTLYWNPNLKPGKDGNAIVEFYRDDEPGKLKFTLEGLDAEGRIISIQKIF